MSLFVAMVRDSVREIAIRMALGATNGRILVVSGLIFVVATAAVGYSALAATRTDPAEHLQAE